ncbi:hypothetical protein [Nocardioides yefusunii]|uniref:PASTA domain-containing protein n=1 Tax=Nocardioides yefusunii TaxID=2500546 RepID=A0ABW1R2P1_9ACTN|nr:hypothetical protein [Nocardioides yefusunii]
MDRFIDDEQIARTLGEVAARTEVGPVPLAAIKEPAERRGWFRPLAAAAAVLAVVGTGVGLGVLGNGNDGNDGHSEGLVAAPGKRLAGLGPVVAEVPDAWGVQPTSPCHEQPQSSVVRYVDVSNFTMECRADLRPEHTRPDGVESLLFLTSEDPSLDPEDEYSSNDFCSASARFETPQGGFVWVVAEAWTPERATEMLSWVRFVDGPVGLPGPSATLNALAPTLNAASGRYELSADQYLSAIDAYVTLLDAYDLEVEIVEDATELDEWEEPTFSVSPEPTSVLAAGDTVTVTTHGIDLPDGLIRTTADTDDAPPTGTRQIGLGDLMMDVPEAWAGDMVKCDVPVMSTFVVGLPASRGCFASVPRPDDVEVVRWTRVEVFTDFVGEPVRTEEFLGVKTTRWETQCAPYDGTGPEVCTAQVWFNGDDSKAYVVVEAPTKARAEALISTLRRSDTLVGVPPAPERRDGFATPAEVTAYLAELNELGLADVAIGAEDGWEDADELRVTATVRVADERVETGTMVEPSTATVTVDVQLKDSRPEPPLRTPSVPGG